MNYCSYTWISDTAWLSIMSKVFWCWYGSIFRYFLLLKCIFGGLWIIGGGINSLGLALVSEDWLLRMQMHRLGQPEISKSSYLSVEERWLSGNWRRSRTRHTEVTQPPSIKFYLFTIQMRLGNIIRSLSTCNFLDVQQRRQLT